jgi:hypothetical protein
MLLFILEELLDGEAFFDFQQGKSWGRALRVKETSITDSRKRSRSATREPPSYHAIAANVGPDFESRKSDQQARTRGLPRPRKEEEKAAVVHVVPDQQPAKAIKVGKPTASPRAAPLVLLSDPHY